jgi:hypothetical protein
MVSDLLEKHESVLSRVPIAIAESNQRKIAELEKALSVKSRTQAQFHSRHLAMEEKFAEYEKSTSDRTAASDYANRRFPHKMRTTSPATVKAPREHVVSRRFLELKKRWRQETAFISSPRELFLHDAYQQIIGLGPQAVPLILAELRDEPGLWHWALHAITRANPIPDDFDGGTQQIAELWLKWGRQNDIEV